MNEQLEKKLITQEEYNKKSEALQNKYLDSLGSTIKTFADKQMSTMMKQMDGINAGKRKMLDLSLQAQIKDDEKTAGKALLPGDIHSTEKKLMEDKYK